MGRIRNAYDILVGNPEGNKSLERPRRRWEENIKLDLREIELEVADWIHLDQGVDQWQVLVNTVMNLRVYKMREASLLAERLLVLKKDSAPCG
jgi:hypothetical protein